MIETFPPAGEGDVSFLNGGKPAAGRKFSGFDPLKCQISFTKMHLIISNPKKNPPAAGYLRSALSIKQLDIFFSFKECSFY